CFPATFVICATINCFFAASAVTLNPRVKKAARRNLRAGNERHSRGAFGRRGWRTVVSSHSRSGQTRGDLRRHLPHYRYHSVELPELGTAPRLYPDAVQGTLTEPAHPRRLEHPGARGGRVH